LFFSPFFVIKSCDFVLLSIKNTIPIKFYIIFNHRRIPGK